MATAVYAVVVIGLVSGIRLVLAVKFTAGWPLMTLTRYTGCRLTVLWAAVFPLPLESGQLVSDAPSLKPVMASALSHSCRPAVVKVQGVGVGVCAAAGPPEMLISIASNTPAISVAASRRVAVVRGIATRRRGSAWPPPRCLGKCRRRTCATHS